MSAALHLVPPATASEDIVLPAHSARREIWIGAALAGALVAMMGIWTISTSLDAAVVSRGVLRVAGSRQVVQAPSDGPISAIRVHDGEKVKAGQSLIEFAPAEAIAKERAIAVRKFGLEAEIARLNAELRGASVIAPPASFVGLTEQDRVLADEAMATEQIQFRARRSVERAEIAAMHDRADQAGYQISGNRQRLESTLAQGAYNREELAAYETLYAKGLAAKPRVLALRRSAAAIDGEAGSTRAEIARLRSEASEARVRSTQLLSDRMAQTADRLRAAQGELAGLLPQWQAARAQLRRTVIRAPFAATVTALQVHMNDAVAMAGMRLLELVPDSGATTVEARVGAADVADLAPGATARVRLTGHEGSRIAPIAGTIQRISADSVEDPETRQSFYTVSIAIAPGELAKMRASLPPATIRSGMPVEVVVATRKRSPLEFLTGPLFERMSRAFTQR